MGTVKPVNLIFRCTRPHLCSRSPLRVCPLVSHIRRINRVDSKYCSIASYSHIRWFSAFVGAQEDPHECHAINESSPENKFVGMRTHTCGSLSEKDVGSSVRLCGWLQYSRLSRFAIIRDSYGLTQVIIPDERKDLAHKLSETSFESVVRVNGRVILRPPDQVNDTLSTGKIEVVAEDFAVLNPANKDLPFSIRKYNKAKEFLQMKHRYLSLRFPELQRNLRLRSQMINLMRKFLIKACAFVEVETPTLFRRTPGGAQEFLVPTQQAGQFYSLVQSPQQLKQLLMVGGIDRYFQVARCYRDESARPDRQPEFTQLDIEMSFCSRDGVMDLVEEILLHSWHVCTTNSNPPPFPRIAYEEAMASYGTDKPDTRFEMMLTDVTGVFNESSSKIGSIVKSKPSFRAACFVIPKVLGCDYISRTVLKRLEDEVRKAVKETKSVHVFTEKLSLDGDHQRFAASLSANPGDWIFAAVGEKRDILPFLGRLRLTVADFLESKGVRVREEGFRFLWVEDFPLFFPMEEGNEIGTELESAHHPFTQPHPDDLHLLPQEPLKVRGLHYDLVCNGCEIGGGSARIHDEGLQRMILDKLAINSEALSHLLQALGSGCPPHAGIALGT
ncbi:aspartate--tRNA ligase, mitochondrial isoform X2 [Ischnura elegans]|uniref:aspartate--tRNA ligase, mitochondrial isoform X2 n=1 Tax=Ischnura elegans TaxID=197161 RepID=UPI001ED8A0D9|nr:aspartate--tRNA ligase, mitochondrial isoform X2 [Ischnura elegans]